MTVFRPEQTSAGLARGPNGGKKRMQTRAAGKANALGWRQQRQDRHCHVPELVIGSLAGSVEFDASALKRMRSQPFHQSLQPMIQ
jgi:hypothetical protein